MSVNFTTHHYLELLQENQKHQNSQHESHRTYGHHKAMCSKVYAMVLFINMTMSGSEHQLIKFHCKPTALSSFDHQRIHKNHCCERLLTQCPGDDVNLVHDVISLSHSGSVRAIQAHCVNFIHKCQRSVAMSDVTQFLQRTYGT